MQRLALDRLTLLLCAGLAFAACGGGGGGGSNAGAGNQLGLTTGNFGDYAKDKNKGNTLNGFGGGLPSKIDMRGQGLTPPPGDQGRQGSCVGWATAFGMKTVQETAEEKWQANDPTRQFSAAFVFNQIPQGQNCYGSQPKDACELLVKRGCATLASMPYSDTDCKAVPTNAALEEAQKYRAARSIQVPLNEAGIKAALAAGNPVVIGIVVYDAFQKLSAADGFVYGPQHAVGQPTGAHAMCLVGYDDAKNAFLCLNSWTPQWGDGGYCWLDYRLLTTKAPGVQDWNVLCMAYTVDDLPNGGQPKKDPSNLTASQDNSNLITLRWAAAAEIGDYLVQRSKDQVNWIDLQRVRETTANDDPGDFGTYSYRVFGVKGAKKDDPKSLELTNPTNVAQGKRAQGGGGGSVQGLRATTDLAVEVHIRWDALAGARRYLVVRSWNVTGGPYDLVDYTSATETRDFPPVQGRPFYYRVAAIGDSGPTPFTAAVEGRTSSQQPLDLSADEMLYPVDQNFDPLPMIANQRYVWPYWVATNWSEVDIAKDQQVILAGLVTRRSNQLVVQWVTGWTMAPSFPADTTIYAEGDDTTGELVFDYTGRDLFGNAVPAGTYYWMLGVFLSQVQNGRLVLESDADMSDNFYLLSDPVQVR